MSNMRVCAVRTVICCLLLCVTLYVTDLKGLGDLQMASSVFSFLTKLLIIQSSSAQRQNVLVLFHICGSYNSLLILTKRHGKYDTPKESQ